MKGVIDMSLNVRSTLNGMEFRILKDSTFTDQKTGQPVPYMTLVVEDGECEQTRISVPAELRQYVRDQRLEKGCFLDLTVQIRGGQNFSSVRLVSIDSVFAFPKADDTPLDAGF